VQWFTGTSGSFQTYNHQGGTQLADQTYKFCFRKEVGYCSYKLSENSATNPDPFQLMPIDTTTAVEVLPQDQSQFTL